MLRSLGPQRHCRQLLTGPLLLCVHNRAGQADVPEAQCKQQPLVGQPDPPLPASTQVWPRGVRSVTAVERSPSMLRFSTSHMQAPLLAATVGADEGGGMDRSGPTPASHAPRHTPRVTWVRRLPRLPGKDGAAVVPPRCVWAAVVPPRCVWVQLRMCVCLCGLYAGAPWMCLCTRVSCECVCVCK